MNVFFMSLDIKKEVTEKQFSGSCAKVSLCLSIGKMQVVVQCGAKKPLTNIQI